MIWENFTLALSKYVQFSGRSRRAEFWSFALITTLFGVVAGLWDGLLFGKEYLQEVIDLLFLVPGLAVGARRLHDTGRSGWWQLIAFTGIGIIVLLFWFAEDGHLDDNEWGESPKYGAEEFEEIIREDEELIV